jgi:hypothetical protein
LSFLGIGLVSVAFLCNLGQHLPYPDSELAEVSLILTR